MKKADVVIVGGGIAGLSTAAMLCSGSDLDVVLIEKRGIGSNQTTPVVFVGSIKEFGLEGSVLRYYSTFVVHSPLGAIAEFDYRQAALASLDYRKSCSILYNRAAADGLGLRASEATSWSPDIPDPTQPLIVHLDTGEDIQTEVLIDASGHAQWAADRLQIERSQYYSHCFGEYLAHCPVADGTSFCFLAGNSRYGSGGGWFYPTGGDTVSMGYSTAIENPQTDGTRLAAGYLTAKREFQPYSDWVSEGVIRRVEGGVIPIGRIGRFVADRILIVGDAAGQARPWVVMGVESALENGRRCARVVLEAFARRRFDRSILSNYEQEWKRINRERFWRTASVAELLWNRSDRDWDRYVVAYQNQSPDQQLRGFRDNRATLFQQAYAVAGYARRQLMKWIEGKVN